MTRTTSPKTILHPTTANTDQLMYKIPSKFCRKTLILFISIESTELRGFIDPTQNRPLRRHPNPSTDASIEIIYIVPNPSPVMSYVIQ